MLFVKATKEKFEEYGQAITMERQLADGSYIKHFELTSPDAEEFFVQIRSKTSFEIYTEEQIRELINQTEPQEV